MIDFIPTRSAEKRGLDIREVVGFIPAFVSEENPDSVTKQINDRYSYGGGWNPLEGFVMDKSDKSIQYPEDPKLMPLAVGVIKGCEVIVYDHGWVAVVNEDGNYEVSRID